MNVQQPFQPQGNTILIAVSSSPSAAQQPSTGSIQGMLATWTGSVPCYLAIGPTTATAAIPTTSVPATGLPVMPNTQPSFTVPPNCWVSAMTSAGSGSLFLTPGTGF